MKAPSSRGAIAAVAGLLSAAAWIACTTPATESPAQSATAEPPTVAPPSDGPAPGNANAPVDPSPTRPDMQPSSASACQKGGCSGELCTDARGGEPSFSPCVYKPELACYKSARCERGADGRCGWVETPELTACLKNPPAE